MAIVHPTAENFGALIRDNKLVRLFCNMVRPVQNDRTVH